MKLFRLTLNLLLQNNGRKLISNNKLHHAVIQ